MVWTIEQKRESSRRSMEKNKEKYANHVDLQSIQLNLLAELYCIGIVLVKEIL